MVLSQKKKMKSEINKPVWKQDVANTQFLLSSGINTNTGI
jgi:hypothetical protein